MRRMLEAGRTPEAPRIYLLTLVGLLAVWRVLILVATGSFFVSRFPAHLWYREDLALHLGLFAFLGVAIVVWSAAAMRGRVDAGTGGGFWIAAMALVARMTGEVLIYWQPALTPDSAYRWYPEIGGVIWFERNVTLMAYGFGVAFVGLSCWSERRLRKRAPAWAKPFV